MCWMRRNVEQVASAIQEKHKRMKQLFRSRFCWVAVVCIILSSCGTKSTLPQGKSRQDKQTSADISPEQQRKYDYFFLEAARLKEKGDFDGAFEMYRHCLSVNPNGAAALYEISRYYSFFGQEKKSEEALKEAVKQSPDNFWYHQTLAAYYQERRELAKAIYVYEDMMKQFPSRLEPLMALVELYTQTKQYQEVINVLDKMEAIDGKSEQISMEKFRMYVAMDNKEKAFEEIKALADEYPYDMRYLTLLGDVYLNNGKPDDAFTTYQEVLQKEPEYVPAHLSLANYYQTQGKDSLYRIQLNKVLLDEDVASDTKLNMMRQLILRSENTDRDSTKIVDLFQHILEKKQENADVAMLAAQYMVTKKMESEATSALNKVLDLDPENTPARLQLLQYAINHQDMKRIVEICKPALEYTPEVIEFYYYMGLAYHEQKQNKNALEVFKKGTLQISDKTDKDLASDLFAIIGDMYHEMNKNQLAYAAYDSALVYKPDNIGALNNYAYYLSVERKQLDKAEEMSYRTVQAQPTNNTYLDTYAWILFEKGKYVEAKIYMDQAMQNGGDQSSIETEHCGDIYWMNGEKEKALEYWKKAEVLSKKEPVAGESPRDKAGLVVLRKKIAYKKYFAK